MADEEEVFGGAECGNNEDIIGEADDTPIVGGDSDDSGEDADSEGADGEADDDDDDNTVNELDNDMIDTYFEDAFGKILNSKLSSHTRIIKVVHPDERITSHIITNPEMARAIAIRAKQIDTDAFAYTTIEGCGDAISIAEKEFNDGKSPLILNRIVDAGKNKVIEKWKVREMTRPPVG